MSHRSLEHFLFTNKTDKKQNEKRRIWIRRFASFTLSNIEDDKTERDHRTVQQTHDVQPKGEGARRRRLQVPGADVGVDVPVEFLLQNLVGFERANRRQTLQRGVRMRVNRTETCKPVAGGRCYTIHIAFVVALLSPNTH